MELRRILQSKNILFLLSLLNVSVIFAQTGSLDLSFNPSDKGFGYGDGFDEKVLDIQIQNDKKIVVGGAFSNYNGNKTQSMLRLNADGSYDDSFKTDIQGIVYSMAIQADGKIVVGGNFITVNNQIVNRITRLNPDGSIDASFYAGSHSNFTVSKIFIQPDNKILVGGGFSSFNGKSHQGLVRLLENGTIDSTFIQQSIGQVTAIAYKNDGKILLGSGTVSQLNNDGSVDSGFNAGISNLGGITDIKIQNDNKILVAGESGIIRLEADGKVDPSFNNGKKEGSYINHILILSDGKILLSGKVYTYKNNPIDQIFRILPDGTYDPYFSAGDIIGGPNGTSINCTIELSDSSILLGGSFGGINGYRRNFLARVDANGKLFNDFYPGSGANDEIKSVKILPDGKILIVGDFTFFNNDFSKRVARLNTDGSLDTTFQIGTGANSEINAIAIQADGKIILAGSFDKFNGVSSEMIVRLNNNGSIDNTFHSYAGDIYSINTIAIQSNGKILIGGEFSQYQNLIVKNMARLNNDGTLDPSFNSSNITSIIEVIKVQPDGKIVVGGAAMLNGNIYTSGVKRLESNGDLDPTFSISNNIGTSELEILKDGKILVAPGYGHGTFLRKLKADGTIDSSWVTEGKFDNLINVITVQNDNKIIVGGFFKTFNGITKNYLLRLTAAGKLDNTFSVGSGTDEKINCIELQKDGDVLIAGSFTSYNGKGRNRIARLKGDSPDNCDIELHFTGVSDRSCNNQNGEAVAKAYYGTYPVTYTWLNTNAPFADSASFNTPGVYTCVAVDNKACTDTASLLITGPENSSSLNLSLLADAFRKNFNASVQLHSFNRGCTNMSGKVKLVLDSLVSYQSAQPSPDKIIGDTLIWNLVSLNYLSAPFAPKIILKTLDSANIGDTVHLHTIITSNAETISKDYYFPVINGYDPNDKQVYPRGVCDGGYIQNSQKLTYTVRFQNTGNAEAINIAIVDSLSSNLDLSTLKILAKSDTMYTQILPGNAVKFVFDNIWLPDSTHNEPASHGYVVFEIKPKSNLAKGTMIKNKAEIYFDFNPAVVTNSVLNTIWDGSPNPCASSVGITKTKVTGAILYPNPSNGIFTLQSNEVAQNITVFDKTGRMILSLIPSDSYSAIDLSSYAADLYFIQVKYENNIEVLKAVVK
ncbi:MAG: T9SS type A sorting domain-containing protein [Flavobacteriales bacterium]